MRKPLTVAGMAMAVLLGGAVAATPADAARPGGDDDQRGHRGYGPGVSLPPPPQKPVPVPEPTGRSAVTAADVSVSPSSPVQRHVLILVNERRRQAGCGPLTLDRRLTDAASEHAADMARHGYFAHDSRDGQDAGDRVRDAGFRWERYGENIARGATSADDVVRRWMRSPEHRDNILDCRLREMGVGLAVSRGRGAYWVQDFATGA